MDDDVDFLRTFGTGLERSGFDVVTAGSFQEALDRASEPGPPLDVLIADINLPDGWGARLALALAPLQPDAKVVYISGYAATDPILKEGIEDHMAFLGKPFEVKDLADKVRSVLEA
ncbi:MAG TPA: response regulator [Longimicrobiales bacterium]|nr:response regulator [Longimicrobiales bacterium]